MRELRRYDKELGRYIRTIYHSDGASYELLEPWELLKPGDVWNGDLDEIAESFAYGYFHDCVPVELGNIPGEPYLFYNEGRLFVEGYVEGLWQDMWQCEYCGSEHPNRLQGKCPNCGGPGIVPVGGMRCVWCGSPNVKLGKLCPDCGGPNVKNRWV